VFDYKAVAERIFWAHRRAEGDSGENITFEDLAKLSTKAGHRMTLGQASEYEKGDVPPKLHIVLALAKALGVDAGWLAFGEESGAPAPPGWVGRPQGEQIRDAVGGRPSRTGALGATRGAARRGRGPRGPR
jgi:transcriptional regulator with XRE-family HTH domain